MFFVMLDDTCLTPVLPLVCGFISRDNVRAWRELFMNLYLLILEEYIHFERIYRVCRFGGLSWNFARIFQRWQTKVCREILIFNKVFLWRPFTQHVKFIATPTFDVNISITNQNIEKARHTFVDWWLVNKTVQPFCSYCGIRYPMNSIEEPSVALRFIASWHIIKENIAKNVFFS